MVSVFAPVGLQQDAVDLLEIDGAGAVADGLDERAEAEVAHSAPLNDPGLNDPTGVAGREGLRGATDCRAPGPLAAPWGLRPVVGARDAGGGGLQRPLGCSFAGSRRTTDAATRRPSLKSSGARLKAVCVQEGGSSARLPRGRPRLASRSTTSRAACGSLGSRLS